MLARLKPTLNTVGITVYFSPIEWDATMPERTAELVDRWFANSPGAEEYLVVIANFSGEGGRAFSSFERSFQHLHERLYDKACTVLWVEPAMIGARSYLKRIVKLFQKSIGWFTSSDTEPLEHTYHWYHPFQHRRLLCNVLVQKYVRS